MHHPSKIVYLSSNVSIPGSYLLEGASQLVFSKHYMKNTGRAPAWVTPKPRSDEVSRTSSRRREQDSPTKGCLRRKLSIILIDLRILRVLLTLFLVGSICSNRGEETLAICGKGQTARAEGYWGTWVDDNFGKPNLYDSWGQGLFLWGSVLKAFHKSYVRGICPFYHRILPFFWGIALPCARKWSL